MDYPEGSEVPEKNDTPEGKEAKAKTEFSEKDMEVLLKRAEEIQEIPLENVANSWRLWAQQYDVSIEFDNFNSIVYQ